MNKQTTFVNNINRVYSESAANNSNTKVDYQTEYFEDDCMPTRKNLWSL